MTLSSKTLQNCHIFWNKKTQIVVFSHFHFEKFWTFNNGFPGLYRHRPRYPLLHEIKKKHKNLIGIFIPKIWQIWKRFARQFHQA